MTAHRLPGPLGRNGHSEYEVEDGTMIRGVSPRPGPVCRVGMSGANHSHPKVIRPLVRHKSEDALLIQGLTEDPSNHEIMGAYQWLVRFSVPLTGHHHLTAHHHHGTAGYIYQEVQGDLTVQGQGSTTKKPYNTYYEAWPVDICGKVTVRNNSQPGIKGDYNDAYQWVYWPGSDGLYEIRARVLYIGGALAAGFDIGVVEMAGDNIASSTTPPPNWESERAYAVKRHFKCDWALSAKDKEKWVVKLTVTIDNGHRRALTKTGDELTEFL